MSFQNSEIVFLTKEEILLIHKSVLFENEPSSILNENMLESALNQPQASFGGKFLYETIYEMAAAYLISFAKDHVFVAANKRVALNACLIFLQRNKHRLLLTNDEAIDLTLKCVTGEYSKNDIVNIIAGNTA